MRLLIDANLSPVVSAELRAAGHEASHVYDHGLGTASDAEITMFAVRRRATVVS